MNQIDGKYRAITLSAIRNVQNHLTTNFSSLKNTPTFELQGSVATQTEIKVHSDADLLIAQNDFHNLREIPVRFPYKGSTKDLMINFKQEVHDILNGAYSNVTIEKKCINVDMGNPKRNIDVVPVAFSFNDYDFDAKMNKTGVVTYQGGLVHNTSFPFKVRDEMNGKGNRTINASKALVRYLKNIKVDSDLDINLSSFEIYSFLHSIEDVVIYGKQGVPLSLILYAEIELFLAQRKDCEILASPCKNETPFRGRRKHFEDNLRLIKEELDALHFEFRLDEQKFPNFRQRGIKYFAA